ncbi:MAG: hypothetical protein IPG61_16620 [bacterium]|nr:hypothetical protein [bacterium]
MAKKYISTLCLLALLAAIAACNASDPSTTAPIAARTIQDGGLTVRQLTDRSLVAGPFTFERSAPGQFGTMRPRFDEFVFELDEPAMWEPGFFLRVQAGRGPKTALTSAVVMLNGQQILGPDDFAGAPVELEVPVVLQGRNVLGVKILGSPDSTCEIVIEGVLLGELHARVVFPGLGGFVAWAVPLTLRVSCEGWIGDDHAALPQDFRTLMIPAVWNGMNLSTYPTYIAHVADLVAPTNPAWSDWQPYAATEEERSRVYPGLSVGQYYLFAVQVRDAAGRVSTITDYNPGGREVMWMRASNTSYRPEIYVWEETLGGVDAPSAMPIVVTPGQILAFSWWAEVRYYNGIVASYRHGWDLLDPNDPLDPGWAVEPGLAPANQAAEPVAFASGEHILTIRAIDDFGQVRTVQVRVVVTPAGR